MNKKLLLLAGALTLSLATVSLAASPPPPENNDLAKPGADWKNEKPVKHDAKAQTTDGTTYPDKSGGVKNDNIGDHKVDPRDEKPVKPDPKVQTTDGKTRHTTTGVEDNEIGTGR